VVRVGWAADRWRLYGLAVREAGRTLSRPSLRLARSPSFRVPTPDRLLFAPQDLRTSDATHAADMAEGYFTFAGRTVEVRGGSPFAVAAPSPAWAEALYGFAWLRHHKAAGTAGAREAARALVAEAIGPHVRRLERGVGRETAVVARRLISFLCQSPLLLNGADHGFYGRFLRVLGRSVAALEKDGAGARDPLDRMAAAIALSYAALCCGGFENRLRRATRLLTAELDAQVLADGGHVSRNPAVLVDLLLDLLPLRLLYKSRGIAAPEALSAAVDRMMPMLRFLRHGTGELALFNGMGATAIDHVATLLSHDVARAPLPRGPGPSGYARLEGANAVVIVDVGPVPPVGAAGLAGAGCLSFEFSTGRNRLVVNAGTARAAGSERRTGRETAAHSTLGIGSVSSALLLDEDEGVAGWLRERLGPVLLSGPKRVTATVEPEAGESAHLIASHDGWCSRFAAIHHRTLRLASDGSRLEGEDHLAAEAPAGAPAEAVLRFHLHPAVRAELADDGSEATLALGSGERWGFKAEGGRVGLEDSTYHGGAEGWRPTRQLVVRPEGPADGAIRWSFARHGGDKPPPSATAAEILPEAEP
jgi:uncharacterized heparinase superfamily protein